jgi:hypothetical protein
MPMPRYRFASDAVMLRVYADSADEAARAFAATQRIRGIDTMADLLAYFEGVGGLLTVEDDAGVIVARVR